MWKQIEGYLWPYRINEEGHVEKLYNGKWVRLTGCISARNRAVIKMRTADNKKKEIPVVWLMADAFMGGRIPGTCIIHKDRCKANNAIWNLKRVSKKDCGLASCKNRRRPVKKIDRDGTVVEVYPSVAAAAKKNFISKNAVYSRCVRAVKDPFRLDGHDYRYDE